MGKIYDLVTVVVPSIIPLLRKVRQEDTWSIDFNFYVQTSLKLLILSFLQRLLLIALCILLKNKSDKSIYSSQAIIIIVVI